MLLSLRKVYLSSTVLHNAANPVTRSRSLKIQAEKPFIHLRLPKGLIPKKNVKKEKQTVVPKETIVPKVTAMKDYVPEVKVKETSKNVEVKAKKPKVDKVREHFLSLGKLRTFEPPRELDTSFIRNDVPDPVPQQIKEQYAPALFMRGAEVGGLAKVMVLNDYETYNTMNLPLYNRLDELIKKWEHDKVITSIVWESSLRNFSAGIDYQTTFNTQEEQVFLENRFKNAYTVYTMRKPFVPIMSGLVLGNASSIGLLANCSMSTDTSMFTIPEPSFGYIPDAGVPFALSRTGIRGLGEFLAVSGYTLKGHDLFLSRLSRYFMPDERIYAAEIELGCIFSNKISRLLNSINAIHEPVYKNTFSLRDKLPVIGPCFDKGTIQEVFQALEASDSAFATQILNKMKTFSPLALAVSHRLVREAHDTNIETSLKKNFIAAQNMMRSADYAEGIKAKVENRAPKWSHKSVFDVTKEEVDAIFSSNANTKSLELQASSYVPLNGPVFRYIQSKTTPQPLVGGSMIAELDNEESRLADEDYLGKLIYRRSQIKADRAYYRLYPEKVAPWMPGGEKAKEFAKKGTYALDLEEDIGEEIPKEKVEEFLKTATSAAEPTGLLPDYDFLKTSEPPVEESTEPKHGSPYFEQIQEEEFPVQDDTVFDEDVIEKYKNADEMKRRRARLLDSYDDSLKVEVPLPNDIKMWISKLDREDEY